MEYDMNSLDVSAQAPANQPGVSKRAWQTPSFASADIKEITQFDPIPGEDGAMTGFGFMMPMS
jgi:hypothetical protein